MKNITLFCLISIPIILSGQNGPVSLMGQYSYDLTNTHSLPAAKIECKKIATMMGIRAHLVITYPETLNIDDETLNCIYDNLLTIEVVEETINGNTLFIRVISSTNTNLLGACLP